MKGILKLLMNTFFESALEAIAAKGVSYKGWSIDTNRNPEGKLVSVCVTKIPK